MVDKFLKLWARLPKMPLYVFLGGTAFIVLCFALLGCATEQRFTTTATGAPLHWPKTPVRIALDHEGLGPDWVTVARACMGQWNDALGFQAFTVVPHAKGADALMIAHDGDDDPSTLATTSVFAGVNSGEIAAGVVFVPVVPMSVDEAYHVIRHELGHLLGLAHDPTLTSTMYATGGDGVVRTIAQHSIDALRSQYVP